MTRNSMVHGIYLLIILVLVVLMLWPDKVSEPESVPATIYEPNPASEPDTSDQQTPAYTQSRPESSELAEYEADELLQVIAERDAAIGALEARISELEDSLYQVRHSADPDAEQQLSLSDEEYIELVDAHRRRQEAEREQAFANARPTAASDRAQQQIESSFYRVDNIPPFEALSVECRDLYCDIEVTFDNQDMAREFLTYHGRRVFDEAEIRTTMTRSEMRDNLVTIKADLAPPLEE